MKKALVLLLAVFAVSIIAIAWLNASGTGQRFKARFLPKEESGAPSAREDAALKTKLHRKWEGAIPFIQQKGLHAKFSFFIDMSLPSGRPRFFVYDNKADSVLFSGPVTHGRCNQEWLEGRRYSNTVGSGCTSLGKYRTGTSYHGRFGLAYKLHGLESSNSNAFKRYVVLHSHECVPENGVEDDICQSDGCPTVAPGFLKKLDALLRSADKPVLLWIFE